MLICLILQIIAFVMVVGISNLLCIPFLFKLHNIAIVLFWIGVLLFFGATFVGIILL